MNLKLGFGRNFFKIKHPQTVLINRTPLKLMDVLLFDILKNVPETLLCGIIFHRVKFGADTLEKLLV